jgi:hypothetical protein
MTKMLAPEKFSEIETNIYLGDFSKASDLNFVEKYKIKRILRLIHEPINNNIRFEGILYEEMTFATMKTKTFSHIFPYVLNSYSKHKQ